MNKKYTYKPTSSVKYDKGGKNKKNKKKTYKVGNNHYNAQVGGGGDGTFDFPLGILNPIVDPIFSLIGIGDMMDTLGGAGFMDDAAAAGGVYGMGELQQAEAAGTGADMATNISSLLGFDPANLGSVATLQDQIDNIGIAKPKKVSTEFVEGIKDTIGQQTAGVLGDIGRTGKMAGIRDVMQSTDQALIGAQEKAAGMDERYEGQLVDIDKFETGQTTQLVGQQAQQEFGAATSEYDLAGDLASQSAEAGGDLSASAISGIIELQGQSQAAWSDLLSSGFEAILGLLTGPSDKKLKKNIEKVGETESGVPVSDFDYKKDKDAPEGPGRYRGVIAQDLIGTEHEEAVKKINKNTLGVDYSQLDVQLQKIEEEGKRMKAEKGAKMQEYEEGAKQDTMPADEAEVTPGKFSHEENPIDVVQDGEKIGEMTGGEAIMPPKDVAEFEQLILEKDKNGVFNKLKSLFIKWDQKAREHEEKNMDQKAMAGARMGYMPKSKINYR